MPNQEWSEEYEKQLTRDNLDNLCKFLKKLSKDNWENPRRYSITEYFPYDGNRKTLTEYELINLKMTVENDGVVYSDDAEGILEEYMKKNTPLRLQAIVIDDIINIIHSGNIIVIWTSDAGYIKITY